MDDDDDYKPLAVLGKIKEKGFSAAQAPSLPSITALPFPVARHRSHGPHWGSISSSRDEIVEMDELGDGSVDGGRDSARPLQRKPREDTKRWREMAAAAAAAAKKDTSAPEEMEIDAENQATISSMSSREIEEAHRDLLQRLGPDKVEMLRRRGLEKKKQRFQEGSSMEDDPKFSTAPDSKKNDGSYARGITTPVREPEKRQEQGEKVAAERSIANSWTERVEAIRLMRFGLGGELISSSDTDMQDNPAQRDYLRTEGDPSALGYTIKEAALLSRSTVPAHRAAGIQLLGTVLVNTANGLQGKTKSNLDWQAIWAYALGPNPELTLTLRLALDDTHLTSIVSSAKALQAMLSSSENDEFFNLRESAWPGGPLWYTAPVFRKRSNHEEDCYLGAGFWKYNVKPSELLISQSENIENENNDTTVSDDVTVATKDVAAGLIRMGILPRIRYILEVEKLDLSVNTALLSVLVAFARHSPAAADAVMKCPRLINTVIQRFLLPDELDAASVATAVRAKSIQLLKVLSQVSKSYCVQFAEIGALQAATSDLFEWSYRFGAFAADEFSKRSSCLREALRLWKICICHGIGIGLFADFHPALSVWLSPRSTMTSTLYDLAQESYSVLDVLARTLPVLVRGHLQNQALESSWSWNIAIPIVSYGLSWIRDGISADQGELKVLSSVIHFLASICERLHPEALPDLVSQIEKAFGGIRHQLRSSLGDSSIPDGIAADLIHASARLDYALDKLVKDRKTGFPLFADAESRLLQLVNFGSLHEDDRCGCCNRGGPAPGVGFGWSSRVPGGGFCSSKMMIARVYASSMIVLLELEKDSSSTSMRTILGLATLLTESSLLERALSRHVLSEERWFATLDEAVKRLNLNQRRLYDVSQLKGGRDFLLRHFTEFWLRSKQSKQQEQIKNKLETIREEDEEQIGAGGSMLLLTELKGMRIPLPCHWILSPLHSRNSDVILAGLLLLLGLEQDRAVTNISIVRKVHALSTVFLAGDVFLDEPVSDALGSLQDLYFGSTTEALDFRGGIDPDYASFAEGLAQHYAAASYGDLRFGRQIAVYFRSGTDVSIQAAIWRCLGQAEVLNLLPKVDECGGDPAAYFDPPQRNAELLEIFVSSWMSGGLDRAFVRKALPFAVALHHIAHFVLNAGDDDETVLLRRQKFARGVSRSSRRCREAKEMFGALLQYFPDKFEQSQQFFREAGA